MKQSPNKPKVVIIGGGFGGLRAAKLLGNKSVDTTLVDRKNHHTFQPLLYQVATAVLSPGEIAAPIRRILHRYQNTTMVLGEVVGFDRAKRTVKLYDTSEIPFDYLIVAAGARHSYFGHDEWERDAPGLKTVEDAVEIRRRVLLAFELAERDAALTGIHEPLVFAIIGGGPTGVELAGAIAGIARLALAKDFKLIDTTKARVLLFEGSPRVLGTFAEELSVKAENHLRDLGVEVFTNSLVKEIEPGRIKVGDQWIECSVALWGTGVMASPLGKALGAEIDRAGRVIVEPDLSIRTDKNIFVIGDMASFKNEDGTPVPGVAPAAMQEADLAVKNILADLGGQPRRNFKYKDRGNMATIGRNVAIAQFGKWQFDGFFAWILWLVIHVMALIDYRSRIAVLSEWMWAYFTRERSARLITGDAEDLQEALRFIKAKSPELPEAEQKRMQATGRV
jgi:NADH dehydrogenase